MVSAVGVVNVIRSDVPQPRAVQIPDHLTNDEIDDVLYPFGFERFGADHGVQRLIYRDDDMIEDCLGDRFDELMKTGAPLFLWDRDFHDWLPVTAGDWVVEPQDDNGDGFIKLSAADFATRWAVLPS